MAAESFHLLLRVEPSTTDQVRMQIEDGLASFLIERSGQKMETDLLQFVESFDQLLIWWNQLKQIVGPSCRMILIRDENRGCACYPESMQLITGDRKRDLDTPFQYARETIKSYL